MSQPASARIHACMHIHCHTSDLDIVLELPMQALPVLVLYTQSPGYRYTIYRHIVIMIQQY